MDWPVGRWVGNPVDGGPALGIGGPGEMGRLTHRWTQLTWAVTALS